MFPLSDTWESETLGYTLGLKICSSVLGTSLKFQDNISDLFLLKIHGVTETMREHSRALIETLKKLKRCPEDVPCFPFKMPHGLYITDLSCI